MEEYKHYQAILVKYLGPTATKRSRISLKDLRFNENVIIPIVYGKDIIEETTIYLTSIGYQVVCYSFNENNTYIVMVRNFRPIKEMQKKGGKDV